METKFVETTKKTGEEMFFSNGKTIDASLVDFWSWAYSDLVNNTERGKLAEFIVAHALGISDNIAATWASYDLIFMKKGIEIKSSAYLQSWSQQKESRIEFSIKPALGIIGNTGTYDNNRKRQSDVYVFCYLKHLDKLSLNPMDLNQWEFFVVPTAFLDKVVPLQQKISLSFFSNHNIQPCQYSELRCRVEEAIIDSNKMKKE